MNTLTAEQRLWKWIIFLSLAAMSSAISVFVLKLEMWILISSSFCTGGLYGWMINRLISATEKSCIGEVKELVNQSSLK